VVKLLALRLPVMLPWAGVPSAVLLLVVKLLVPMQPVVWPLAHLQWAGTLQAA
jgi:hypothetical protein